MYIPKDVPDKPPVKLLPQGTYNFEVINAEDSISKSKIVIIDGEPVEKGLNQMIKLTLKVWDDSGEEHLIWDYLIDLKSMWYKSKHFLQAVGSTYEDVNIKSIHCLNKSGKLLLDIQIDKTGKYSDKNVVRDYVVLETITPNTSNGFVDMDEDLPL